MLLAQFILDILLIVVIMLERIVSCLLLAVLNIFTLLSVHDLVVRESLERRFSVRKWRTILLLVVRISDPQTKIVTLHSGDSTTVELAFLQLLLLSARIESACCSHHLRVPVLLRALHDGVEAQAAHAGTNEESGYEDHQHSGLFHRRASLILMVSDGCNSLVHVLLKSLLICLDFLPSFLLDLLPVKLRELVILIAHPFLQLGELANQEVDVHLFVLGSLVNVFLVLLDPHFKVDDARVLLHDAIEQNVDFLVLLLL